MADLGVTLYPASTMSWPRDSGDALSVHHPRRAEKSWYFFTIYVNGECKKRQNGRVLTMSGSENRDYMILLVPIELSTFTMVSSWVRYSSLPCNVGFSLRSKGCW